MLPNPSDLTFFLEISHTLNMSRAAERLGITQPALSQSMKRLEHAFGQQLLLRGKGGVALTKVGEKFAHEVKDLIEQWERLKDEGQRDENDLRGRYTIGMHPSVALFTVGDFVPDLVKEYNKFEIKFVHDLSRRITEEVISFKIDFAITVNPVEHPDLVIRELNQDEVTFWKHKETNSVNDIESPDRILICEPDLNQTQDLMAKLNKKGLKFPRTLTSNSLEVIKELTVSGSGIGLLPGNVVGEHPDLERVMDMPVFNDRICLVYRADMQKNVAARLLTKILQEKLKRD